MPPLVPAPGRTDAITIPALSRAAKRDQAMTHCRLVMLGRVSGQLNEPPPVDADPIDVAHSGAGALHVEYDLLPVETLPGCGGRAGVAELCEAEGGAVAG